MTFKLTTESGAALTERWHDQTLDLESLEFNKANRTCSFAVTEVQQDSSANVKSLFRKKLLQRSRVTVRNVTCVQVLDAEGEGELYINEVEAGANRLCVKCVNGTLELRGEELEITLDTVPSDTTGETEVSVATPIGDISWRRKHTNGQS